MSRATRLLVVFGALAIVVIVFVALRPSDDEPTTTATTQTQPEPAATVETTPVPPPKPKAQVIEVRNAEPVDGVQPIDTTKGETVRFVVQSDVADEVHLHGYDIAREVAPGKPARFEFKANVEGIFEIELEQRAVEIATLTVEP
jgi:hypothetical protein